MDITIATFTVNTLFAIGAISALCVIAYALWGSSIEDKGSSAWNLPSNPE